MDELVTDVQTTLLLGRELDLEKEGFKRDLSSPWLRGRTRRRLDAHGLLAVCIVVQFTLTIREWGNSSNDVVTNVTIGRDEVSHLLHSTVIPNFDKLLTSAPFVYPTLADAFNYWGGPFMVRAASLIFALLTTAMVFGLTRRLFGWAAANCAATIFALSTPVLLMGTLPSSEAFAAFLLVSSGFVAVCGVERRGALKAFFEVLAGALAALAALASFLNLLLVPALVVAVIASGAKKRHDNGSSSVSAGVIYLLSFTTSLGGVWRVQNWPSEAWRVIRKSAVSPTTWQAQGGTSLIFLGVLVLLIVAGIPVLSKELSAPKMASAMILAVAGLGLVAWQVHLNSFATSFGQSAFAIVLLAPVAGASLGAFAGRRRRRAAIPLIVLLISLITVGVNTFPELSTNATKISAQIHLPHVGKLAATPIVK
jgi:hypothetical protein